MPIGTIKGKLDILISVIIQLLYLIHYTLHVHYVKNLLCDLIYKQIMQLSTHLYILMFLGLPIANISLI